MTNQRNRWFLSTHVTRVNTGDLSSSTCNVAVRATLRPLRPDLKSSPTSGRRTVGVRGLAWMLFPYASVGVGVLKPRAQQLDRHCDALVALAAHAALAALATLAARAALAARVAVDLEALLKERLGKAARLLCVARRGRRDARLDAQLRRLCEERASPRRARLRAGLARGRVGII